MVDAMQPSSSRAGITTERSANGRGLFKSVSQVDIDAFQQGKRLASVSARLFANIYNTKTLMVNLRPVAA
jgi:hypothetical protein